MVKLEDALQECTLALLRKIATSHAIPVAEETLRAELAVQISQTFAGSGYLAAYAAELSGDERQALRFLADHEWSGQAFLLERQFAGAQEADSSHQPMPLIVSLLQKGLIYRSFGTIGTWRGELYHVPEEIREAIASSIPANPGPAVPDVRAGIVPEAAEQRDSSVDLFCLLSFLRRGDRRAYQGFLSRFDLPKLEQETGGGASDVETKDAERRWRFLLHLALAAGWVRRDGPLLKPGRLAVQLLSGDPREVRQRIVDRYLKERSWSDLTEAGRVRQSLGSRRIDETAARQVVLHYLREFSTSAVWISEASFCDAVHAANPDFLREDYASLSSAMVDVAAEAELSGADSWDPVEGEWIRYVLRGPLYWLGIVRWGRDSAGRRTALQFMTEVAAHDTAPLLSAGTRQAVFRDDLGVFAPAGVDLGLLYRIEPYMILRARDAAGSSYRLSKTSVLRGLEVGGSWEELRDLMGQLSALVPEHVFHQIQGWCASYGRLVLEGGVLLTAATEEEAEAVGQAEGLAHFLSERLGRRTFRVVPERTWQLADSLREAGQAPLVDPSVGAQGIRSVAGDVATLQESLFAILVLRSLHGPLDLGGSAEAQRRLELALGPDNVEDVAKRAQDAVKRLRSRGEGPSW